MLIAYLVGSIPFGLLFAKGKGVDIRQSGSGNIGATNVSRQLGKALGILTLVADISKAVFPMLLTGWLLKESGAPINTEIWVVLVGGSAFLGHLFPVYLKFKGGKGVATGLGIFLLLEPLAVLISLLIFIGSVFFWGYVSLGSLVASALLPFWIWVVNGSNLHIALALFISLLIWLKHYDNIVRLLAGEEKSWKKNKSQ